MGYGDLELDAAIAKLFDLRCVDEVYKNSQEHVAQATKIYEKNTPCKECGQKTLKVISFKDCEATCNNCGAKQ